MIGALLAAAWSLVPVGERPFPMEWQGRHLGGLSGIAWAGDNTYYAVRDDGSHGELFTFDIGVDLATGRLTNSVIRGSMHLEGRQDTEGVVWDRFRNCVWASDEHDASIRAFSLVDGRELESVELPPVYDAYRFNFSLESLTLRANGLEMWTCNEEALCRADAYYRVKRKAQAVKDGTPDVNDGPLSSNAGGSTVRLLKLVRAKPTDPWRPAGQWAYLTDSIAGARFLDQSCSGVADLLCLDDGTLLVLERELSLRGKLKMPSFRCRIYQVDFEGADDVSGLQSLKGAEFRRVVKRRVFAANTGFAMYEGICLGPRLADGSRCVLLISDGDSGAANRIYSLKLQISDKKGMKP